MVRTSHVLNIYLLSHMCATATPTPSYYRCKPHLSTLTAYLSWATFLYKKIFCVFALYCRPCRRYGHSPIFNLYFCFIFAFFFCMFCLSLSCCSKRAAPPAATTEAHDLLLYFSKKSLTGYLPHWKKNTKNVLVVFIFLTCKYTSA